MRVAHGLYQQTVVRITEQDGRTRFARALLIALADMAYIEQNRGNGVEHGSLHYQTGGRKSGAPEFFVL